MTQFLGSPESKRRDILRIPVSTRALRKPRLTRIAEREIRELTGVERPPDIRCVHVTIDAGMQRILDEMCRTASAESNVRAVAATFIRNGTGEVVAESNFVGEREAESSAAFLGTIQPGSTYKPFVLLEALEQGLDADMELLSAPFVWHSGSFANGAWNVRSFDHVYHGQISLERALVLSDNTVFARLVQLLGTGQVLRRLAQFGLARDDESNPSAALGSTRGGINLIALSRAYAGLSQRGVMTNPYIVRGIEFEDGSLIPRVRKCALATNASIASFTVLDRILLQSGISRKNVRGKTGTSASGSLFAGYDDDLSYAVWIGFRRTRSEWWSKGLRAKGFLERTLDRMAGRSSLFIG
jgi:penicillin-binding protein 1A